MSKNFYDIRNGKTLSCGHVSKAKELVGLEGIKFNKLTAIKDLGIQNQQRLYLFKCDCGNEVVRMIKEVKRGKLMSCGCGVLEGVIRTNTTHGMTNTRIYNIYRGMYERCFNKNNKHYNRYGGRGITICESWLGENGFMKFYEWALNNGYSDGLSIDRINNNGNYTPKNCRWADRLTQQNNRSITLRYTYEGKTQTLTEWCRELNLNYDSVLKRIHKYNYTFEKAITYKIHKVKLTT